MNSNNYKLCTTPTRELSPRTAAGTQSRTSTLDFTVSFLVRLGLFTAAVDNLQQYPLTYFISPKQLKAESERWKLRIDVAPTIIPQLPQLRALLWSGFEVWGAHNEKVEGMLIWRAMARTPATWLNPNRLHASSRWARSLATHECFPSMSELKFSMDVLSDACATGLRRTCARNPRSDHE